MNHYIFIPFFLIGCISSVRSQNGFDEVYYNPELHQSSKAISIVQRDDGYGLIGTALWFPASMNVDAQGAQIDYQNFMEPLDTYIALNDPVARCAGSVYIPFSRHDSLFLTKFDPYGNREWTLLQTTGDNVHAHKAQCIHNDQLMLIGGRDGHFMVLGASLDGALLWEQDHLGYVSGRDIVVEHSPGDGIFVCGEMDASTSSFIARLRSDGSLVWAGGFGGASSEVVGIDLHDDMIVVAGGTFPAGQSLPRESIVWRFDTAGIFLGGHVGYSAVHPSMSAFRDVTLDESGNILACGIRPKFHPGDQGMLGYIAKFDGEGNVIWERGFQHFHDTVAEFQPELRNIQVAADGGILVCGHERRSNDGLTGYNGFSSEHAWFMKLDSLGCLVPNCDYLSSVSIQEFDPTVHLEVHPNPASEVVHVNWRGGRSRFSDDASMTILTMTGQEMYRSFFDGSSAVDVAVWPAGTYYLHITDGDCWIGGEKLVVIK